jgi:glycosyltransferase involved in cell wall biosynthesis
MISGRDFVVLADDWHGLPTSAIHLFRRVAEHNRVFWFNTIGRLPRPSWTDATKVVATIGKWVRRKRAADPVPADPPGLQVFNPFMVPWFKPLVRRWNCRSFLRTYHRLCAEHNITEPILVTTFPYAADFFRAVPGSLRLYYCVDDFLEYPGVAHADWAVMEAELLNSIDGLIVTSRHLAKKQTRPGPLLHLPHGVEYDHFQLAAGERRGVSPPVLEPAGSGRPARPVVGFFGLLSSWVDTSLISWLSERFPDVSFVLLGRCETDLAPLKHRANVHYLGHVPYADLPLYARSFDVGLIPFVLNRLTRAVNPLKLLEYFALGLPVVSTRLPELEDQAGPLRLAFTREEFAAGLWEILAGPPASYRQQALAVARRNTWDSRAEQFSAFVEGLRPPRCAEPAWGNLAGAGN